MYRFFRLVVCFLILFIASPGLAVPSSPLDSIVSIELQTKDGWKFIGSGVIVSSESLNIQAPTNYLVLTAQHVAVELVSSKSHICFSQKHICEESEVFTLDTSSKPGNDWGLLILKSLPTGSNPVGIRTSEVSVGEEIYTSGYPGGKFLLSTGIVGSVTENDLDGKIYTVTSYASGGSSGGGLYDKDGYLIGIVVAIGIVGNPITGLPEVQENIVYCIPIKSIIFIK